MTTSDLGEDHGEIEMAGLYCGGILGGLVLGSFGDLINSETNSLAWYILGAFLGAVAGTIAGRLFRTVALAPEPTGNEPSTERIRRGGH